MGIYKGQQELHESKRTENISNFRTNENIYTVGIDGEYVIGQGRDLKYSGIALKNYIINSYIKPFKDNGINVYFVFGGKISKDINIVMANKNNRPNDYLKLKKNVLKAFTNQKSDIITDNLKKIIWNELILYFKSNAPDIYHPLYEVYNNPLKVFTKNNYKYYMRQLGEYVWDSTSSKLQLFNELFVEKQTEIPISDVPFDILWEMAYEHWNEKMAKKRLEEHIEYIKKYLVDIDIVNVVDSTYDSDDQLIMMVELGIIDAIVSKDSDMFAYNSKIVIIDIDSINNTISYIKINNMYTYLEKNGYTKKVVKTAMIISSADYNYYMYDNYIPFKTSLEISKKFQGNYYKTFKYFCQLYKKTYDKKIANDISHAFMITDKKTDILDAVKSVVTSLYNNENPHLYVVNILLSKLTDNNVLNIKNISCHLQLLQNYLFKILNV